MYSRLPRAAILTARKHERAADILYARRHEGGLFYWWIGYQFGMHHYNAHTCAVYSIRTRTRQHLIHRYSRNITQHPRQVWINYSHYIIYFSSNIAAISAWWSSQSSGAVCVASHTHPEKNLISFLTRRAVFLTLMDGDVGRIVTQISSPHTPSQTLMHVHRHWATHFSIGTASKRADGSIDKKNKENRHSGIKEGGGGDINVLFNIPHQDFGCCCCWIIECPPNNSTMFLTRAKRSIPLLMRGESDGDECPPPPSLHQFHLSHFRVYDADGKVLWVAKVATTAHTHI